MADGARRLDGYLGQVRGRLRGRLPEAEVSEIVEELRSHVRDSAGSGGELGESDVAAVLERLGSPEELARQYVTESLLVQAGRSRSPWLLLRSLFRWATVSIVGFLAFLGVLTGYVLAAGFLCAALVKPFAPARVGLWRGGDELSLHLGFVSARPSQGEELLGWWIVPLGLLLGAAAFWLTRRLARWAIRRFRRTPLVPGR